MGAVRSAIVRRARRRAACRPSRQERLWLRPHVSPARSSARSEDTAHVRGDVHRGEERHLTQICCTSLVARVPPDMPLTLLMYVSLL